MKLQKQLSRKLKQKEYVKWILTIPPEDIEKVGWKEGENLQSKIINNTLLIERNPEPSYEQFRKILNELLHKSSEGLKWGGIREKLNLEIKVPNNRWVKRLETDIGLKRFRSNGEIYWYVDKKDVTIYTVGYEGKTLKEFIETLKNNQIKGLIDVRELPLSRKNGFSKSVLEAELQNNNIVYRHYPQLGSPRKLRHKLWNEGNYPEFFDEYSKWISSPSAKTYLADVEGLAHIRKSAIMCFEKDVNKCHRSILKKRLIEDGFKVVDL